MKTFLATAPVLHADQTTGRANQALAYVHIACTRYLTMMHVGGHTKEDIDEGGILPDFTGVLVRDGYAGYDHLPAVHAWCAAHLLRDLRAVSDTDPTGQLWAVAMADTLTGAHRAAQAARAAGAHRLDPATVATLLNHYLGALAKGTTDNRGQHSELATRARTLISRFRRFQDMILRFGSDLTVPFTNNEAQRSIRPVKVQQKTSGGCWRTLAGLTEFALVHSYLNTAHKWGLDKLQVLQQLFTPVSGYSVPSPQLNSYIGFSSLSPLLPPLGVVSPFDPDALRVERWRGRDAGVVVADAERLLMFGGDGFSNQRFEQVRGRRPGQRTPSRCSSASRWIRANP